MVDVVVVVERHCPFSLGDDGFSLFSPCVINFCSKIANAFVFPLDQIHSSERV